MMCHQLSQLAGWGIEPMLQQSQGLMTALAFALQLALKIPNGK
jgi:hypothetical protein